PLDIAPPLFAKRYAPFYENVLQKELDSKVQLDALRGRSAVVRTGFSKELQLCGEEAISKGLAETEKQYPRLSGKGEKALQAGLVSLDPVSGLIRAWVGGRDYGENQYDHVVQAKRPVGSTIKPFIYITAIDPDLNSYRAATPRSILPDEPITVKLPNGSRWTPSNADRKFRGPVTLRYALEHSLNLPPIHVTRRVGIDAVQRTLKRFQVHPSPPKVLALALGALETDLLSLTAGYGAIANGGRYTPPKLFERIEDPRGDILFEPRYQELQVADPGAAFIISDILRGVVARGTGKLAQTDPPLKFAAGKTGTSQDARDAWFVGFTERLVTGVWVGFDDNRPVRLGGGSAAAPIWRRYMECSAPYIDQEVPIPPRNVVRVALDGATGDLYSENCPENNKVYELFLRGTEPVRACALHGGVISSEKSVTREADGRPRREPYEKNRKNFFERLFGL
ncbi:MAG: hypothetical protein KDD70_15675, partial [Bdellovibrionales bacterium]|nr:hypothetical protein [Bdellovibrionales bacterium]